MVVGVGSSSGERDPETQDIQELELEIRVFFLSGVRDIRSISILITPSLHYLIPISTAA